MRTKHVWIAAVGLALLITAAVLSQSKPVETVPAVSSATDTPITIGVVTWPGYVGLFAARDKGYFKEEGVNVTIKTYAGFGELADDYRAGKIQARASLTSDVIEDAYAGVDHRVVLMLSGSSGGDGIIARKGITDMTQVKGLRVAYEHGTMQEFLLRHALERNGLKISDIVGVNLDPVASAEALVAGKVDVAVTYEPSLTASAEQVGGNVIFTTKVVPELIVDMLTVHSSFIDRHPDVMSALVKAHLKGVKFYEEHHAEALELLGAELGVSAAEADIQMSGIHPFNAEDNFDAFTFATSLDSVYGNLRIVNSFLQEQGKVPVDAIDSDALVDRQFIRLN